MAGDAVAQGTRIHLFGRMRATIDGTAVEEQLPGRQGRMLFGYLATHRQRWTPRQVLYEVLWPHDAPAAAEIALAALLAKVRKLLGPAVLAGRGDIRLLLAPDAWVDLEIARDALHRADSALAGGHWAEAWGPARVVTHIAERGLLPGFEAPWIDGLREDSARMLMRAYECVATACLHIGGAEIVTGERAARALIEVAPLRESGWAALMRLQALQGNFGEALSTYERLRARLREELGVSPGPQMQQLHAALLRHEPPQRTTRPLG